MRLNLCSRVLGFKYPKSHIPINALYIDIGKIYLKPMTESLSDLRLFLSITRRERSMESTLAQR